MGSLINIEIEGMAELKRRLEALPQAIQTKIMKGVVSTGAAVIKNEAIRLAPEYTGTVANGHPPPGTLKAAIYQTRLISQSIGTRETWLVSVRRGKNAKGSIDAYYATFVEYGTEKMPAHPYMRPAFESSIQKAIAAMGTYFAYALPDVVEHL